MENTVIDNFDFEQNENEQNENSQDVNQAPKGKLRFANLSSNQKNTLLKGGSGLAVLMLGAGALMAFSNKDGDIVTDTDNSFDDIDDGSPEYADNYAIEEFSTEAVEVTFNAPIATSINSEMNFSEAFEAAREEIGAGGFFMHNNQVFNTYYKEEWDAMSKEDKEAYVNSIADHVESVETIEIEPTTSADIVAEPIASNTENTVELEQESNNNEITSEPVSSPEEASTLSTDIEENNDPSTQLTPESNSDTIEPSEVKNINPAETIEPVETIEPLEPLETIEPIEPVKLVEEPSVNNVEEAKIEARESLDDIPNDLEDLIFGNNTPNEEAEVVEMEAVDSNVVDSELLTQDNETIIMDDMDVVTSEEIEEIAEIDEEEIAKSIELSSNDGLEADTHSDFVYDAETEELIFSNEVERDYEELPDDMVSSLETEDVLEDELNFETTNELDIEDLPEDTTSNDLTDDVSDLDLF